VSITGWALQYRGSGYAYGGPGWPPGNWDCSSFVSTVLGRGNGLPIPGGRYGGPQDPPNAHGPDVSEYATWGGAVTVMSPAPGDLVVWDGSGPDGHIGIYLGPDQMISALNTAMGTVVTPVNGYGPAGLTPFYRRVTGATGGTGGAGGGGGVSVVSLWAQAIPGLSWKDLVIPAVLVAGVLAGAVVLVALVSAGVMGAGGYLALRGGRQATAAVRVVAG
jgi:hypothetical protein